MQDVMHQRKKNLYKNVVKQLWASAALKGADTQMQPGRRRGIFCDVKEVYIAKGEETGSP